MNRSHPAHLFVFAAAALKSYPQLMSRRRLMAVITGVLFLFSSLAHGFAMAGMAGDPRSGTTASATVMASDEPTMDCGDKANCTAKDMQMACFAHCVSVAGILSEPARLPIIGPVRALTPVAAQPLASLHGPPEPHPPKSIVLI